MSIDAGLVLVVSVVAAAGVSVPVTEARAGATGSGAASVLSVAVVGSTTRAAVGWEASTGAGVDSAATGTAGVVVDGASVGSGAVNVGVDDGTVGAAPEASAIVWAGWAPFTIGMFGCMTICCGII